MKRAICALVMLGVGCDGGSSTRVPLGGDAGHDDSGVYSICEVDSDCPVNTQCLFDVCLPAPPDEDGDTFATSTDCDDEDVSIGQRAERACDLGCGEGVEKCLNGTWEDCNAPTGEACVCTPGEVRVLPVLMCGRQTQICSALGVWEEEGVAQGQGECTPGELEVTGTCDRCGTLRRLCSDNCTWGPGVCDSPGVCEAGSTQWEAENCGECGLERFRSRECNSTCGWEEWSDYGECEIVDDPCEPDSVETFTIGCGDCGEQSRTRTCESLCTWGTWGAYGTCESEGECSYARIDEGTIACGACDEGLASRTRTCTATCEWGQWSEPSLCANEGCVPDTSGTREDLPCGSCAGTATGGETSATRTCASTCEWGSWESGGLCSHECEPTDDPVDNQSCGAGGCGGHEERTCTSTCEWGDWDTCLSGGACEEDDTQACGCACGTGSQTCDSSCTWGACECPAGECTLNANESRRVPCGACGEGTRTEVRTCGCGPTAPMWGAWDTSGGCVGQRCTPGDSYWTGSGCSSCQSKLVTCNSSCNWVAGSCSGSCPPDSSCDSDQFEVDQPEVVAPNDTECGYDDGGLIQ